ncbi:MAG: sensor histidine kinase [Streptosporangiales bacterium]
MTDGEVASQAWIHRALVILLGPRKNPWRPRRLWSLATLFGLVGPGSIPFAVILTASETAFIASNYHAGQYALWFGLLQCGIPVVLAGYRPFIAWAVLTCALPAVALLATPAAGTQPWPLTPTALFAYLTVQYGVSRAHGRRVSLPTWAITALWSIGLYVTRPAGTDTTGIAVVTVILGFVAWMAGDAVRVRMLVQQRLLDEERETAAERARRQVLEERARIARELHDVVAHHMSVIAVQSSTAAYRIEGLGQEARDEFTEIGATARTSLAEMRRLLAVLRSDEDDALRSPQPGLGGLAPLAEATRRAGTPVALHVTDLPDPVPDAVGLTAYRVVQEGLSNVVRHASGADTTVDVHGRDGAIVVRVANTRPPADRPRVEQQGDGQGLAGMRERVSAAGGELTAGPSEDDGFAVEAVLPVGVAAKEETD